MNLTTVHIIIGDNYVKAKYCLNAFSNRPEDYYECNDWHDDLTDALKCLGRYLEEHPDVIITGLEVFPPLKNKIERGDI